VPESLYKRESGKRNKREGGRETGYSRQELFIQDKKKKEKREKKVGDKRAEEKGENRRGERGSKPRRRKKGVQKKSSCSKNPLVEPVEG